MIFLTEKIRNKNKIEVFVYASLESLAQSIDWQDILDESLRIIDEDGNLYIWDESKKNEVGTVFNYSFKTNGKDLELIKKCIDKFNQLGKPNDFKLDTNA